MDENENIENEEMEEVDDIIVLNDENGEEIQFEFLDLIECDNEKYVVLLPFDEPEDGEGEVVILKVEDTDSKDEESYITIEDEEELAKVFNIFKEKFKDVFNFEDDE